MAVKPKRQYDSSSRQAEARALRARILAAARVLFSRRGFDSVTIEEIADTAGSSTQTVYAAFKSKAGILKAIIDDTFFGPEYDELAIRTKTESDLAELLRITAAISRVIFDREKSEIGILRGASAFSKDLRRVEQKFDAVRFDLQEPRAVQAVAQYPYAAQLGLARVRDIMWMLTGRDVYRMLVVECGWSSDAYETWLAGLLVGALSGTLPNPDHFAPVGKR
jgi:AcrR family transcriptional regulator